MKEYKCINCGISLTPSISYDYRITIENILTHCISNFAYVVLCDDCANYRLLNKLKGE